MAKRRTAQIEAAEPEPVQAPQPAPEPAPQPEPPPPPLRTLKPDPRFNVLVTIERFAADGTRTAAIGGVEALRLRPGVWHLRAAAIVAPPKVGDILTESDGTRWRVSEPGVPLLYGLKYLTKADPA